MPCYEIVTNVLLINFLSFKLSIIVVCINHFKNELLKRNKQVCIFLIRFFFTYSCSVKKIYIYKKKKNKFDTLNKKIKNEI